MFVSSIIGCELRCGLKKDDVLKLRTQYAVWGMIATAACLFSSSRNNGQFGRFLHGLLFAVGLQIALMQTTILAAGLISRERRSQTLGLLFLAGLGPNEIFLGKLLSGGVMALSNLLTLAPFMAIPFLSGGLSWQVFTATLCCLPILLFFALSVTILCSVLCKDEGAALIMALLLGGGILGITPALYQMDLLFSGSKLISQEWLQISPAWGPYMIFRHFAAGSYVEFWLNSLVTLAWAWLALTFANAILRRTWQEDFTLPHASRWRARWSAWFCGDASWRRKMANRFLEMHPYTWRALCDRSLPSAAWCAVAGISAIWLAGWYLWPKHWLGIPNFLLTAILLNGAVECIALYAAGKSLGEDRCSGALELLLTSRQTPESIVEDQFMALRHLFQPVFWTVLALNLAMMTGGFFLRDWPDLAVYSYVLIWLPLLLWPLRRTFHSHAIMLWANLNCGRPAYAVWRVIGGSCGPVIWLWLLVIFRSLSFKIKNFPAGSLEEFQVVGFCAVFIVLFVMAQRLKIKILTSRLCREFRAIAAEPVPEPSDPRLKQWKIEQRFNDNAVCPDTELSEQTKRIIRIMARSQAKLLHRKQSRKPDAA